MLLRPVQRLFILQTKVVKKFQPYLKGFVFAANLVTEQVVHDNGMEFTGLEYQYLLSIYDITSKKSMVKNPRVKSAIKMIQLAMGSILQKVLF